MCALRCSHHFGEARKSTAVHTRSIALLLLFNGGTLIPFLLSFIVSIFIGIAPFSQRLDFREHSCACVVVLRYSVVLHECS